MHPLTIPYIRLISYTPSRLSYYVCNRPCLAVFSRYPSRNHSVRIRTPVHLPLPYQYRDLTSDETGSFPVKTRFEGSRLEWSLKRLLAPNYDPFRCRWTLTVMPGKDFLDKTFKFKTHDSSKVRLHSRRQNQKSSA